MDNINPFEPSSKSFCNKLGRVIWSCCWLFLFRPTPKILFRWRNFLLLIFGAQIGKGSVVYPSTKISEPWKLTVGDYSCLGPDVDCYCSGGVIIGSYVTISQYSYLCSATHDYTNHKMPLITKPIKIQNQAWICAGAFVGPGVTIGQGAVIGARAVVTKNIASWDIVAGNPANFVKKRIVDVVL